MILSREALDTVDLSRLAPLASDPEVFVRQGEHYRLLAQLSWALPFGVAVGIGTHLGDSAIALSFGNRTVHTFDVEDRVRDRELPRSVVRHSNDLFREVVTAVGPSPGYEALRSLLLRSSIVFVDVDPHEGTREIALVRWLFDNSYDGLIVLDDVWYFKPMRDLCWSQIPERNKVDATDLGHWSGTGIVARDPTKLPSVEGASGTSNWTIVTGYFDLTQKPDANDAIRARPRAHYLDDHGRGLLGLDQNLVVFCDRELEERVWDLRPAHLRPRMLVVPMDFEDLPMARYRADIVRNRGGVGHCRRDPRNTASYYLFCVARFAMLRGAIARNEFRSTHFAWANVCLERMGWRNLASMAGALGEQREKFSSCFIDHVSRDMAQDWPAFFGPGGCGGECRAWRTTFCSGFFTGEAVAMWEMCDRVEDKFLACLQAGYGHADEQLLALAYGDAPEAFDWYLGDYQEMVTNYAGVRERPEQPLTNLIAHALSAGDLDVARRACAILRRSVESGLSTLRPSEEEALARAERVCT